MKKEKKKCRCGEDRTFEQYGHDQNVVFCAGCKKMIWIVKKTKITDARK